MWRERCGSSGVAAAADGSSWAEPAGGDQSEGRACVRAGALGPGVLTFAAICEVAVRAGASGGRVSRADMVFEFTKNREVLLNLSSEVDETHHGQTPHARTPLDIRSHIH